MARAERVLLGQVDGEAYCTLDVYADDIDDKTIQEEYQRRNLGTTWVLPDDYYGNIEVLYYRVRDAQILSGDDLLAVKKVIATLANRETA